MRRSVFATSLLLLTASRKGSTQLRPGGRLVVVNENLRSLVRDAYPAALAGCLCRPTASNRSVISAISVLIVPSVPQWWRFQTRV